MAKIVARFLGSRAVLWWSAAILVGFAIVALMVASSALVGWPEAEEADPLGAVVVVTIVALNVYWWGFRQAMELSLGDNFLSWRAPFRSGSLRIVDILAIERVLPLVSVKISHKNGNLYIPLNMQGSEKLIAALREENSNIDDRR